MTDDKSLIKLYSKQILRFAATITHTEPLPEAMAHSRKRSPLCGSNIEVDLDYQNDQVTAFSQNVKACALGQASASILGHHIIGLSQAQIATARDELFALLTEDGPTPRAPFEDLEILRSAQDFRNRHASIMLAFDATLDAISQTAKKTAP